MHTEATRVQVPVETHGVERILGLCAAYESVVVLGLVYAAWTSNALSLQASMVTELVDTAATLVSWMTLRRLGRRQHDFNFGFGKVESLLGMLVALGLAASAYHILSEALPRLRQPQALTAVGLGLSIASFNLLIDSAVWTYIRRIQRHAQSPVLGAKIKAYQLALLQSGILVLTLTVGRLWPQQALAQYLDPIVSIAFVLYIAWDVYQLVARALGDLSDRTLEESLQLLIMRELAQFFDAYEQVHGISSRRSGGTLYVELLLEFRPDLPLAEVVQVMTAISANLQASLRQSRVTVVPTCPLPVPSRSGLPPQMERSA